MRQLRKCCFIWNGQGISNRLIKKKKPRPDRIVSGRTGLFHAVSGRTGFAIPSATFAISFSCRTGFAIPSATFAISFSGRTGFAIPSATFAISFSGRTGFAIPSATFLSVTGASSCRTGFVYRKKPESKIRKFIIPSAFESKDRFHPDHQFQGQPRCDPPA